MHNDHQHPLQRFAFCPVCGSSAFRVNNFKSKHCDHCGFTYYANPCSATAAFIFDTDDRLLVARRAKEPARGTLDLVGGFVDMDETVEEGMRREIREETGLDVEHMEYLFSLPNRYLYSGMLIHTVDMFFRVRVPSGTPVHADDDAAELFWLPLNEVDAALFGLDSISRGVARYCNFAI